MTRIGAHAIVIGASLGGLLAARALADHYDTVTVLERDKFPSVDMPRKGVPQGKHAHGLLARGREIIEQFFPGWTDAVVADGGLRGDIANDVSWVGHDIRMKETPSDLTGLLASRPAIEGHVRRFLLALPNVRGIDRCAVQGLVHEGGRVTGVRASINGGMEEMIAADLVVDAGGRGSASLSWLDELGYPRPTEEKVDIGIGYTTRTYRRRPGDIGGRLAVVIAGSAPNWRNGVVLAQGEDRWIVSIGGYFGDHAPDDDQMFAAYAHSLPVSDIYDVVANAEPLSDFVTYRYSANLRRRYERLKRFPEGYLVFGDAICSFNPVYGQGMTVSAQEALLLQTCLRDGAARLAPRFFKAASAAIDTPWEIAVGNDLRHPKVEGARSLRTRFVNWYIGKLHVAAKHDGELTTAFLKVANLIIAPSALLRPSIVARVVRGNLRGTAGAALASAERAVQ